jgi:methionine aminopeptidase
MEPEQEPINENELDPIVINKYQVAADIANRSLKELLAYCTPGKTILELCNFGDDTINRISKTVFNKNNIKKGIA